MAAAGAAALAGAADWPLPDGLCLEWVYGCRGHDAHDAVHWTASGEVIFHAAAVGVVYDPKGRTQRFFTGHGNGVLRMWRPPPA